MAAAVKRYTILSPLSLFLLLLLMGSFGFTSTSALKSPKLGLAKGIRQRSKASSDGFQILNYTQTLDHFNYRPDSYDTFQQRYAINDRHWGGANTSSPIFVYPGEENSLESLFIAGFLTDNAAHFKALLVFIEHRYYGKSHPFGSMEEAYQNSSTLGYFNSAQALADYAQLIIDLKKNLSAENCPVIAIGGSYGGMLAAWFRLKYPHIVTGALASSAPILYFDNITPQDGYYSVATKDFKEASESCYQTIRESWFEIDKIASQPNGLTLLSKKFKTCRPLDDSQVLKDYLMELYYGSAQYDHPSRYPVNVICDGIDGAPKGTDMLGRIFAGIEALDGKLNCLDIDDDYSNDNSPPDEQWGWDWQECTELVMPIGGSNDTMFPPIPFDFADYTKGCQEEFGVTPRPHWITTEFGGHNIKKVLEKFGSNIIFSNGLRDPYSSGGVLDNISDSIVAIHTPKGSHCLDILSSRRDDPEWLVSQRKAEIKIIEGWIAQYNSSIAAMTYIGNKYLYILLIIIVIFF